MVSPYGDALEQLSESSISSATFSLTYRATKDNKVFGRGASCKVLSREPQLSARIGILLILPATCLPSHDTDSLGVRVPLKKGLWLLGRMTVQSSLRS